MHCHSSAAHCWAVQRTPAQPQQRCTRECLHRRVLCEPACSTHHAASCSASHAAAPRQAASDTAGAPSAPPQLPLQGEFLPANFDALGLRPIAPHPQAVDSDGDVCNTASLRKVRAHALAVGKLASCQKRALRCVRSLYKYITLTRAPCELLPPQPCNCDLGRAVKVLVAYDALYIC